VVARKMFRFCRKSSHNPTISSLSFYDNDRATTGRPYGVIYDKQLDKSEFDAKM